MKVFTKEELTLVDGLFVTADKTVVTASLMVIQQANALDRAMQEAKYLMAQPKATPAPSLEGFEPKSNLEAKVIVKAETPNLDKKVEETLAIMKDLDKHEEAEKLNEAVKTFSELIKFAQSDEVVCSETDVTPTKLDTPELGNILELTDKDIVKALSLVVNGITKSEEEDDE